MSALETIRGRWRRLGHRDRRALALGALVLAPFLLWIAAGRPWVALLTETRERVEMERSLLARELGLLEVADELPGRLEAATRLLADESAGLIGASSLVEAEGALIDLLRRAATRSRVLVREVRAVDPVPGEETAAITPVRLGIRVESDLGGLSAFLNTVESHEVMIRIVELEIEPARVTSGSGDAPAPETMGALAMSLIVEAFWFESGAGLPLAPEFVETRLMGLPR